MLRTSLMYPVYPLIPLSIAGYFKIFTPSFISQNLPSTIIYEKCLDNSSQLSVLGLSRSCI